MSLCNEVIVQTFKCILRINIHFDVRKINCKNLIVHNQNIMKLLYEAFDQEREKLVHFRLESLLINNHLFILERDQCHRRENFMSNIDTYCDFPSTFHLNDFAFKSHSNMPLVKFMFNGGCREHKKRCMELSPYCSYMSSASRDHSLKGHMQ